MQRRSVTLSELSARQRLHIRLNHLLHHRPVSQTLHPSGIVWIILVDDIDSIIASSEGNRIRPVDKAQVGVGALVANEVLLAFQGIIEDHRDAYDLFLVALDDRWYLLGMEVGEPSGELIKSNLIIMLLRQRLPCCLAEIRSLARDLEIEELFTMVVLRE